MICQYYAAGEAVLWNPNDLLRFQFRLWKSLGSSSGFGSSSRSGSGSGSKQYLVQFFNRYLGQGPPWVK
jgi:hypothetical protein